MRYDIPGSLGFDYYNKTTFDTVRWRLRNGHEGTRKEPAKIGDSPQLQSLALVSECMVIHLENANGCAAIHLNDYTTNSSL